MTEASAPGKVILFGEHAVVYGRPAIAVPVTQVRATAIVEDSCPGEGITIVAQDLQQRHTVGQPANEAMRPLEMIVLKTLEQLGLSPQHDLRITIRSTIPIGRGMGSGAAVCTAIVRALAKHYGASLSAQEVSGLVYQAEVIYHSTPSGIDNSVISFEQPVYFVRGKPLEFFRVEHPFRIAVADTGIFSPTKVAVGDVRQAWQRERERYEAIFEAIGRIAIAARAAIERGDQAMIGHLMDENQALLRQLNVSSLELERLIAAAKGAGALGAKLCGAGRGGNMIALVTPKIERDIVAAVRSAGATSVLVAEVGLPEPQISDPNLAPIRGS